MILTPAIVATLLAAGFVPMPTDLDCPSGDVGGQWQVKVPPVQYVRYVTGPEALGNCDPGAVACASIGFHDDIPVGLVYSAYPIDSFRYPEWLKTHELCHLLGWRHGPWWL